MKRLLLFVSLIFGTLHAADSWYERFTLGVEAGIFMNDFGGDIENATPSKTDFQDDLNYKDTYSSFFALHLKNDIKYLPDLEINYMNVEQNKNAILEDQRVITEAAEYNSTVRSKISYSVLNTILKSSFKFKGSMKKVLFWNLYTGDIEYNLGLNAKFINYRFDIEKSDTTLQSFISVNSAIILPYAGMRYYWYDFILYGHASALSFSDAKATSYEFGVDYRIFDGLYVSASYMHEDFEATEKQDTVTFRSYGNKLSIKYNF